MKIARLIIPLAVLTIITASAIAAPVESVESTTAKQKVTAFLGEKAVVDQLTKLGITPAQAQARVAKLSDAQLESLAAQIDTLQAGGMIQSGHIHPIGPLACVFAQLHQTFMHIVHVIFCWDDIR